VVIVGGVGIVLLGVPPSAEEIGRLIVFIELTSIYVGLWLALAQLFSVLFKQAATSALASIAVWLFFAIFAGMLVGLIANGLAPAGTDATDAQLFRNAQLTTELSRVSPVTLYTEATAALLDPGVRSLGVLVQDQVDRALAAPLGFQQSLILVWPQIVLLLSIVLLCFTVSYILFMREEIRA
jgi:ABC-2 type transport system permease protein